ncbi:MAG: DUF1554 domain-containing protein [Leptospirales bacterium]|nr:DUF1554 domain-containing protein [Leptospirales bacterium]
MKLLVVFCIVFYMACTPPPSPGTEQLGTDGMVILLTSLQRTTAAPSGLSYSGGPFSFTQNVAIISQTPMFSGTITSCTSSPALPSGLSLSSSTCALSGTPTGLQGATMYAITAMNELGSATATITISVVVSGHKIYVPSGPAWPHNANLGGPTGADALCNNSAQSTNKPSGTYKAMVVDSSTRRPCATPTDPNCSGGMDPSWIMQPSTTYYRADGTTVVFTTNANGIVVFGTITQITTSSFGVWTGLNADWTNHGNDCSAWTSSSGGAPGPSTRGKQGQSDQTNGSTLAVAPAAGQNCATTGYVYCVEQ